MKLWSDGRPTESYPETGFEEVDWIGTVDRPGGGKTEPPSLRPFWDFRPHDQPLATAFLKIHQSISTFERARDNKKKGFEYVYKTSNLEPDRRSKHTAYHSQAERGHKREAAEQSDKRQEACSLWQFRRSCRSRWGCCLGD